MCNLLVTEAIKESAEEDRPGGKQDDSDLLLAVIFDAIRKGQLKLLKGIPAQAEEFFKNFDPRMDHGPYLTVR